MLSQGMGEIDAEPGHGELSSPCVEWDMEQGQVCMLQFLHGREQSLKHRKGLGGEPAKAKMVWRALQP